VTLRHRGHLVVLLVAGVEVRILALDSSQLRRLRLDPAANYRPMPRGASTDVPRHLSPMSRDITQWA